MQTILTPLGFIRVASHHVGKASEALEAAKDEAGASLLTEALKAALLELGDLERRLARCGSFARAHSNGDDTPARRVG